MNCMYIYCVYREFDPLNVQLLKYYNTIIITVHHCCFSMSLNVVFTISNSSHVSLPRTGVGGNACPALGPSGVWSAHGTMWLLSTRRANPLHYSPAPSHSVFSVPSCSTTNTLKRKTFSQHACLCISPASLPYRRLVQSGKVWHSEVTARRIFWWGSLFIVLFFNTLLWTALTCVSGP